MRRLITDFPEARTCPSGTLRALRAIDPATEVLYLGPSPKGGRWALGRVVPSAPLRSRAMKNLRILARMPEPRRDLRWARRVWLERAKYQGFQQRYVYECDVPGSAIVENVRHAYYDNLRTREMEHVTQLEQQEYDESQARERDLIDKHRAHEAHHYAFSRSHAITRSYTEAGDVDTRSSVRTIHSPTPAA